MSDGYWEAVRGSHCNAEGASTTDRTSAVAHTSPGATDSGITRSADPIVGWRVWGMSTGAALRSGSPPRQPVVLVSVYMNSIWQPGDIMTACCGKNNVRHGIHAFASATSAIAYMSEARKPMRYVFGQVSLWGRVVIHEHGYRAAFAYPRHIFVPDRYRGGRDYVHELRSSYGVEADWTALR